MSEMTEAEGDAWDALWDTDAARCCPCPSCNYYAPDYEQHKGEPCVMRTLIEQIIAARVTAALNEAADEALMFDPSDNYHDADQRKSPYYAAIDRCVTLLHGEIASWTDSPAIPTDSAIAGAP